MNDLVKGLFIGVSAGVAVSGIGAIYLVTNTRFGREMLTEQLKKETHRLCDRVLYGKTHKPNYLEKSG